MKNRFVELERSSKAGLPVPAPIRSLGNGTSASAIPAAASLGNEAAPACAPLLPGVPTWITGAWATAPAGAQFYRVLRVVGF